MKNKLIAVLFAFILILSAAALAACKTPPEHSHVYGGKWQFDENEHWRSCLECGYEAHAEHSYYEGVCRICGYKTQYSLNLAYEGVYEGEKLASYAVSGIGECTDKRLVIAGEYNSLPVTAIKAEAFKGLTTITSVTVPSSVEEIGDYAFQSCTALENLNLSEGLRAIGKSAFLSCVNLTAVIIPDSVTTLGASAFSGCQKLVKLSISGGVSVLESGVFTGCGIQSVNIPDGVKRISALAFLSCSSLAAVNFGKSVANIAEQAFQNCANLQILTVSADNPYYASEENCVIDRAQGKLILGGSLGTIPSGVKSIGSYAFMNYAAIEEIKVPFGVTDIGNNAFSQCINLQNVYLPETLVTVGASAFSGCEHIISVYFGGSAAQWGNIHFNSGNEYLTAADKTYNAVF